MVDDPVTHAFSRSAQWLWGEDDVHAQNAWRYFRGRFHTPKTVAHASLLITADSRYELNVNGQHLGRGPARGFPFHYYFDLYDVTAYLRAGAENVIAVLANHLGDHTFSYIRERPGFICELILEDRQGLETRIVSDESWRTKRCDAFHRAVPRISLQLEFEEQFDSRAELLGWQEPGYDDGGWDSATPVGSYGAEPWGELHPRPIPFLTEDPVSPVAVEAAELAKPKGGVLHYLDLRKLTGATDLGMTAGTPGKRGRIVFSEIYAPKDCTVEVYTFANYERVRLRVGDRELGSERTDVTEPWHVPLKAGRTPLMTRDVHWPAFLFACDEPLTVSAERFLPGADWVFLGDLDENTGEVARYWEASALEAIDRHDQWLPVVVDKDYVDVALLTATQNFYALPGGFCSFEIARATPRPELAGERPPLVDAPQALLHDTADWTTVYPQGDGDVHLVIDFGRELIGYLRLDLDTPEGAVVDVNAFEGIDDGGLFFMNGTRNSFRYTCRAGRQRFVSHQRRGFRYLSVTFRELSAPLKVRHIDTLLSTYPVSRVGSFACSDATLSKIWEVAAYTVQLCMVDTYVDCPAYEQVYWVGDARNSALVNAVAFGAFDLTAHCLRLAGQSLVDNMRVVKPAHLERPHLVTSHVVSGWFNEIPMWTFLWMWMAWEHFWHTGDQDALGTFYDDVKECLRRCEGFLSERDLFDIPDVWNLVDWAAQDLEPYGEVVSNTVLLAQSFSVAARMAQTLGRADEAERYTGLGERLREAVNAHGWSEAHRGYVDTVRDEVAFAGHQERCAQLGRDPGTPEAFRAKARISEPTNTLALLCGAVPKTRREAVLCFVLAAKEGRFVGSSPEFAPLGKPDGIVPVGSPWFLFFTLETLFNAGYAEDAMTILREQWNRMLEKGATTFWETFPGEIGSGHWSRSLCHGWSAAPAYFLSTQVLGVTPAAPGYQKVQIAPKPFHLSWARGQVPTPLGPIYVAWQLDDAGEMVIKYGAPSGCDVEVVMPDRNSGEPTDASPEVIP